MAKHKRDKRRAATTRVRDFDVAALRQLAEMQLPTDPVEAARLWRHVGADLAAAADEIERLEAVVAEVAA